MKRIAEQCPIMEAVYWYNVTPKDNVSPLTAPANLIHCYRIQLKGINTLPPDKPKQQQMKYNVGDCARMKTLNGRYMSPYTRGHTTGVINIDAIFFSQSVFIFLVPSIESLSNHLRCIICKQ